MRRHLHGDYLPAAGEFLSFDPLVNVD